MDINSLKYLCRLLIFTVIEIVTSYGSELISLVNELLPVEWMTGAMPYIGHTHLHEQPTGWFKWGSTAVLLILIINGYIMKYISRRKNREADRKKTEAMKTSTLRYRVEGMTCDHCKATVEIADNQIKDTIENPGYRYMGRA